MEEKGGESSCDGEMITLEGTGHGSMEGRESSWDGAVTERRLESSELKVAWEEDGVESSWDGESTVRRLERRA